ncbi:MAG TPA: FG-GAP-like repeat-containing protein [Verrucomicrobiae bacterium]|nr:FG-GAP-like repeat-containing protein [Verrucomicrobiae bacterium]
MTPSKLFIALALSFTVAMACHAQGTSFTYQGRLNSGGALAGGNYDLQFTVYDTNAPAGNLIAGPVTNSAVAVSNGLFTVALDFGAGVFTGPGRWLEIAVRTNGANLFITLVPRQPVTPAPYAIMAYSASNLLGTVSASQITSGTLSSALLPGAVLTNGEGGVNLTGSFTGNAGGLTNLPLAGIGAAGTFGKQTNAFAPAIPLTVGVNPRCVAVADINGDGKPDLISADNSSPSLTILTNNGNGGFALSATLFANNPVYVVVADMNGDGKPDLICGNIYGNALQVFTNNGTGGFVSAGQFGVGGWPLGIAVADVNGDGKPDLISANYFQGSIPTNTLTVLTNNGSGGWGWSTNLTVGKGPNSVVAMDFNGDGKLDLACASYYDGTLTVLTNNGHGGFVLSATLPGGLGPDSLVAKDLNGDGKPDLIWGTETGSIMIDTNNGSGGFGLYASLPISGYAVDGVAVADINGDGKLDLVTANDAANSLTVLTNNGAGSFGIYATVAAGSVTCYVAAADVNGDGKLDLISANVADNTLSVVFNLSPAVTAAGGFLGAFAGNGNGLSDLNAAALIGSIPPGSLTSVPASSLTGVLPAAVIPANLGVNSLNVDQSGQNVGSVAASALTFGIGSGEGIASKRTGANIYDLEFFTGFLNRMAILSNGNVGIGTTNPASLLEVNGGIRTDGNELYLEPASSGSFANDGLAWGNGGLPGINTALASPWLAGYYGGSLGALTPNTVCLSWDSSGNVAVSNLLTTTSLNVRGASALLGHVAIGAASTTHLLAVGTSGAYCDGTTWVNGSDRNTKQNFGTVDPREVLAKVSALPITKWQYKVEDTGTEHIGPMAQDFHAAFGLNGSDDKHISTVDEGGVALAAIQGLNQKVDEKNAEIQTLKQQNDALTRRLNELEAAVKAIVK